MQIRAIINRLDERQRTTLGEILRFAVVGVIATLIQAVVYWLFNAHSRKIVSCGFTRNFFIKVREYGTYTAYSRFAY